MRVILFGRMFSVCRAPRADGSRKGGVRRNDEVYMEDILHAVKHVKGSPGRRESR